MSDVENIDYIKQAGIRYSQGEYQEVCDGLTVEEPLQININGKAFTVTMRTPGADDALVKGLLFTEGVVDFSKHPFKAQIDFHQSPRFPKAYNLDIPEIYLCPDFSFDRSLLSSSSCGLCGKSELKEFDQNMEKISNTQALKAELLNTFPSLMKARQKVFSHSGGSHSASLFSYDGDFLVSHEDIGRHNAVDKVIGEMITADYRSKVAYMMVSGRISFEIVNKAYMAGIPCITAVSAPSSLAVRYGEMSGVSIVGFCRETRATVYSCKSYFGLS